MSNLEYYHKLIDYSIITEDALDTICNINGFNTETLDDVLFERVGYRDWEQYEESEL